MGGKLTYFPTLSSLQKPPAFADLPGLSRIWGFVFFLIVKVTHAYDFKNANIQRGV